MEIKFKLEDSTLSQIANMVDVDEDELNEETVLPIIQEALDVFLDNF